MFAGARASSDLSWARAGKGGHARRLATQPDRRSTHSTATNHPKRSCKEELALPAPTRR